MGGYAKCRTWVKLLVQNIHPFEKNRMWQTRTTGASGRPHPRETQARS